MKIIVIGALPASLYNFRGDLIRELVSKGHQVTAMASGATKREVREIESLGAIYKNFPVKRNGLNPFEDIRTFLCLIAVYKQSKPDVILAYTIKPIIWGGIAARFFSNIKFYGLVTGLGFAFQEGNLKRNLLSNVVKSLYRSALIRSSGVIFQNMDNLNVFVENKIVDQRIVSRVHGSGVKLEHFNKSALTATNPVFLSIARLLGEKGLREYSQAAKLVKKKYPDVVFQILGPEDSSPDGIPISEVNKWHKDGYIDYLGSTIDVRSFIDNCHIFVLASYHEGMPRTVLEAMAIGRPILTTNVAGCKETVSEGENGFLVEKGNVEQLVERMVWFIENRQKWQNMANQSHKLALEKYDVHKVNHRLLEIMELN